MPAASIRKSKRRIGALAVETSHRLHDRACCGPCATQGPCRRDSIVVVSVWPGLQREGAASLAEISLATGFTEQSHFSRVFKEVVGVPPGTWQRQHRF